MEIHETKKTFCKFTLLNDVVKEHALFGWTLSEKTLLNRFGQPVPYGVTYGEDDLREKCSFELSFFRVVDCNKIQNLNKLHNKYSALTLKPTRFSKGRIFGLIMLSLLFSYFFFSGLIPFTNNEIPFRRFAIFLTIALLAIGFCVFIILKGVKNCKDNQKENDEILAQKQHLALQAKQLLEETNT